jgi:hypothetical protein
MVSESDCGIARVKRATPPVAKANGRAPECMICASSALVVVAPAVLAPVGGRS